MFDNFFGGIINLIISLSTGVLGVIPGVSGHDVEFSEFEFSVLENRIFISARINDELNPRINDIIKSGRSVRLNIISECFNSSDDKKPVKQNTIQKVINYNVLKKQYEVSYSHSNSTQLFVESNKMWEEFLSVRNQPVFSSKVFTAAGNYFIKVTARLETELEVGGRNLDLMLFWNNKPPTAATAEFDNKVFTL